MTRPKAEDLKALPSIEEQLRAATPESNLAEALQQLATKAETLLSDGTVQAHRLIHLREAAAELDLNIRDGELRRLLADARRRQQGIAPAVGGRALSLAAVPWMVEGLVLQGGLNVLLAPPKVGKSSLVTALISQWARGAQTFLGLAITAPCPPVLIVGPDQPECDWARMLRDAALLTPDLRLGCPLVDLFTAGQPLQLDDEGIELIASYAAKYPGLLVVIDSLAAVTRQLGISENDPEIAQPVSALIEAIEPHAATLLLIHHSSKARIGESPSLASRGSSAIPALASQTIGLHRLNQGSTEQGKTDRRVVLKTEGRGGMPLELLIERVDANWICHGDAETVQLERHRQELEDKLQERQADALAVVRERWEETGQPTDASDLAHSLGLRGDGERKARRALEQLAHRGLVTAEVINTGISRRKVYRPVGTQATPVSVEVSEASGLSEPTTSQPTGNSQNTVGEWVRTLRTDKPPCGRRGVSGQPSAAPSNHAIPSTGSDQPALALGISEPFGSGADAFADADDPHWPSRAPSW